MILVISLIIPFSGLACSKSEEPDTKKFVGIAIYQKLDSNLNWSKFSAKPNAINNIVSTKDDKIVVDEEPELLFYVYTQNEITSSTTDKDFISNTTKDTVTVRDSAINFRFERMIEDTEILIYYGEPTPYSVSQEIYMDFLPQGNYLQSGIWKIKIEPVRIVSNLADLWLPVSETASSRTRFLTPTAAGSFTVPAAARNVISVAAYDSRTDASLHPRQV